MTGFGRAATDRKGLAVTAEIRSTNHRYLKVGFKLPSSASGREQEIESLLRTKVARGSLEVSLRLQRKAVAPELVLNEKALLDYHKALTQIQRKTKGEAPAPSLTELLSLPGVIAAPSQDVLGEEDWKTCLTALKKSLAEHVTSRKDEGKRLTDEIESRLADIRGLVDKIRKRSPRIVAEYRKKLTARMTKALGDSGITVAESDFLREIAAFTDRADVCEELDRLKSHLAQFAKKLRKTGEVGRELDFILQEMFREINTIGSKAGDAEAAHLVVAVKVEIEKIREQVQNLE